MRGYEDRRIQTLKSPAPQTLKQLDIRYQLLVIGSVQAPVSGDAYSGCDGGNWDLLPVVSYWLSGTDRRSRPTTSIQYQ